jgi:LacI family transcriptional regulator
MDHKPATIKEIADRLRVSVSTVSRALHDHPSIGSHTKMQVRKLAEELNYEPNRAAISFKQGKSFTIGVILPNLGEEFFSIAINGIENVATANNYTVLIGQSRDDVERERKIVDTMRRHRVDGLIVSLSKTTRDLDHFQQLKQHRIPVVFFDRVPEDETAYSVSCNLGNSSVELVDWLVKNGHSRIGFIMGPGALVHATQRLEGYFEGLKKNGIAQDQSIVVSTDLSREGNYAAMENILRAQPRPTAVIAFNDYVALDATKYSRNQGLKVNHDISFVSYANLPVTSYLDDPPIASVEQFPFEQAEQATTMLLQLIGKNEVKRKVVLEGRVVKNA